MIQNHQGRSAPGNAGTVTAPGTITARPAGPSDHPSNALETPKPTGWQLALA
jgi:hypothetical protein